MPKYRALTLKELHNFEKEFIEYLAANSITATDWEKLKATEPEKAEKIVSLFSDVVFEGVLRNIKYLEFRSPKQLFVFQCNEDKMVLRGLRALPDSSIDFNLQMEIAALLKYTEVVRSEKPYNEAREIELFQMLEKGCKITDEKLFEQLGVNS